MPGGMGGMPGGMGGMPGGMGGMPGGMGGMPGGQGMPGGMGGMPGGMGGMPGGQGMPGGMGGMPGGMGGMPGGQGMPGGMGGMPGGMGGMPGGMGGMPGGMGGMPGGQGMPGGMGGMPGGMPNMKGMPNMGGMPGGMGGMPGGMGGMPQGMPAGMPNMKGMPNMGGMPGGMGGMPGGMPNMGGMPGGMGGMPGGQGMPGGMGGMPNMGGPQGGMPNMGGPQGGMPNMGGPQGGRPNMGGPQGGMPNMGQGNHGMPGNPEGMKDPNQNFDQGMGANYKMPDGGRGKGPSLEDINYMGMPKNYKKMEKRHASMHDFQKQTMDPSHQFGADHGKKLSDKEEFQNRFQQMWNAYVNEPGQTESEKARRNADMNRELESMAKSDMDKPPQGSQNEQADPRSQFEKSPFDHPDQEHEKPLSDDKINEGLDKITNEDNKPASKNDIRNIKRNVFLSKHILNKVSQQRQHFKEVIARHGEPAINDENMPNMESLPQEQQRWFKEYKEKSEKLKRDLKDPNYNLLNAIGLYDNIPAAICLVASMKPGVHEASQKMLQTEFNVQDNNGQIPMNEMNQEKHEEVKKAYEIVEKVIVDSIERCTKVLELSVRENGFVEVAKLIDVLIPMYVPYKRVAKYLEFNKDLAKSKDFTLTPSQEKIKKAQDLFNMHLGVKFTASFEIMDQIINEVKMPVSEDLNNAEM